METIIITDEELIKNGLKLEPMKNCPAQMCGFIDRKVGYTTELLKYEYDHLYFENKFTIRKFLSS